MDDLLPHLTDISIQSEHKLTLAGSGFSNKPIAGTWIIQNIAINEDRVTVEFYSKRSLQEKRNWQAQVELLNDLNNDEVLLLGEAIKVVRERHAQNLCNSCKHNAHDHDFAGCNYQPEECLCQVPFGGTSTGPHRS